MKSHGLHQSIARVGYIALVLLGAGIGGCGNGGGQQAGSYKPPAHEQKSNAVTETEHQQFERKYTEDCIKSQHKDTSSDFTNDQELGKVCSCMATTISKRIGKADAVHFLKKGEFPFDLVMMTNSAANVCLGKK